VLAGAKLADIGLTGARAESIRALARAVCAGKIKFERVVDSDAFLRRLCEILGIGKWTAQYVATRALGEPDAFPSADLALLHALALGTARELEQRAEGSRPWRCSGLSKDARRAPLGTDDSRLGGVRITTGMALYCQQQ
jgi:3-methyladenine DNA glycosylase/8-oxoguanine DNA glycosylase